MTPTSIRGVLLATVGSLLRIPVPKDSLRPDSRHVTGGILLSSEAESISCIPTGTPEASKADFAENADRMGGREDAT